MGSGYSSRTVLGSTHVVEPLLFSMFPLAMTFDFGVVFLLFLPLMSNFRVDVEFKYYFEVHSCS